MSDNLHIWKAVCETNPENTKFVDTNPRKKNSRKFTAIDAYSQIQKATEIFGPIGIGWGYTVKKEILENCFLVELCLWYKLDGERYEIPSVFEMSAIYGKYSIDIDAPKKAVTGAITKALSYLGFNADVFLGKYDDNKYIDKMRHTLHIKKMDDLLSQVIELHEALPDNKRNETSDYVNSLRQTYLEQPNMDQKLMSCISRLQILVKKSQQAVKRYEDECINQEFDHEISKEINQIEKSII